MLELLCVLQNTWSTWQDQTVCQNFSIVALSIVQLCEYVFTVGFALYVPQNFFRVFQGGDVKMLCSSPQKAHLWVIPRFWATAREHLSTGLTCGRWREKNIKVMMLYFTTLPRRPRWTDFFYRSWYGDIPPRRNHIFKISYQLVKGFCDGSNFAVSHRKAWSPLTRCCTIPCRSWYSYR